MARIIHVARRFTQDVWGGTESTVMNLCRHQLQAGDSPEIHTSRALCDVAGEELEGVPIRRYRHFYTQAGLQLEGRRQLDFVGGNLLSLQLFSKLLAARNVRLFHAHALGRLGGQVLTVARLRRLPVVVTVHGNVFDAPTTGDLDWRSLPRGLDWGKPFGLIFSARKVLDRADAVICVGRSEYELARDRLGHGRIYHLSGGVDLGAFANGDRCGKRRELGLSPEHAVFGCVSRIDAQKDQLLLIEAFERVHAARPNARLVLAGPVTQPGYAERLRAETARRGLGEFVRWLPAVSPASKDHADLLAALDLFVLPSRHEPFGLVVLEAWAARKPVIAARVGGLVHLIQDGIDGLHFAPGSAGELADRMQKALADPLLRTTLAENGLRKASERYSWQCIHQRLEAIYCEAERRAGRPET